MSGGTDDNAFATGFNLLTNAATMGLFGYNDQGFKAGYSGQVALDGTKEITGAKAAEEANAMAKQQFDDNVTKARQDRVDAQSASKNNAIAASQNAGSARSSNYAPSKKNAPVVGDVNDFLGL